MNDVSRGLGCHSEPAIASDPPAEEKGMGLVKPEAAQEIL